MEYSEKIGDNDAIRHLLDNSYFMDPVERLTYKLLLNYAFVLHEDVTKVTDEEIEEARIFAKKYLKEKGLSNFLDLDMKMFVNQQTLKAITDINYKKIEDSIIKKMAEKTNQNFYLKIYIDTNNYDKMIVIQTTYEIHSRNYYIYDLATGDLTLSKKRINEKNPNLDILNTIDIFRNKSIDITI